MISTSPSPRLPGGAAFGSSSTGYAGGMAEPLTNIGTSRPPQRPLTEPASRFRPPTGPLPAGAPEALPVAGREGEAQQQFVAPDPLWTSRWQPSKTVPLSKAPWVVGYRWWHAAVKYQSWGPEPMGRYRLDLKWRDHAHAYLVPRDVWEEFRLLTTSVGQWFHRRILGPGWRPGRGSLFPDFPL